MERCEIVVAPRRSLLQYYSTVLPLLRSFGRRSITSSGFMLDGVSCLLKAELYPLHLSGLRVASFKTACCQFCFATLLRNYGRSAFSSYALSASIPVGPLPQGVHQVHRQLLPNGESCSTLQFWSYILAGPVIASALISALSSYAQRLFHVHMVITRISGQLKCRSFHCARLRRS